VRESGFPEFVGGGFLLPQAGVSDIDDENIRYLDSGFFAHFLCRGKAAVEEQAFLARIGALRGRRGGCIVLEGGYHREPDRNRDSTRPVNGLDVGGVCDFREGGFQGC